MPRILPLLILFAGSVLPCAARAHEQLVRSTPAAGDTLATAPTVLRLTFSSRVRLAFSGLDLLGPDGRAVALGPLRTDPDSARILVADIRAPLAPGAYVVAWRTGGADGHPVRGRFDFVVAGSAVQGMAASPADSSADSTALAAAASAHASHGEDAMPSTGESDTSTDSPLQTTLRWITFLALIGVIGVAAFRWLVLRAVAHTASADLVTGVERGARSIGLVLAGLLLVAVVGRLVAQWVALGGRASDVPLVEVLTTTEWGWGWLLQLSGTLAALAGLALAHRASTGWGIVLAAALLLGVSPALSGHAAATGSLAPVTIAADALHVFGAGAWIGSLLLLVLAGLPAALALPSGDRGPAAALLVNRFSAVALGAATILILSGAVSAWVHLGSLGALLGTTYGRTLLVKLALVALVAALGAFHWRRVRPALGSDDSARRIRRTAGAEIAIAAVVILVTAILVATPPPRG